jgi:HNH endonuclease
MRTPIPENIAAEVLFRHNRTCCICNEPGKAIQIHHIDGNPSNNSASNLAVVCFDCHNDTQVSGGFGRKLNAATLMQAIESYRVGLALASRTERPLDWAATQNNLGAALETLGARESGTARLEEAVAAYRDALKERTRERVPLNWAASSLIIEVRSRKRGIHDGVIAQPNLLHL